MSRYYPKPNLKGYKVSCNTFGSRDLPCHGTGHGITCCLKMQRMNLNNLLH